MTLILKNRYYISEPRKSNTAATGTQLLDQKLNVL